MKKKIEIGFIIDFFPDAIKQQFDTNSCLSSEKKSKINKKLKESINKKTIKALKEIYFHFYTQGRLIHHSYFLKSYAEN